MSEVNAVLRARFELGVLSTDQARFYERAGWERFTGPSFVRDGDALLRTPDEDDGLLILRFGESADVDVTDPICCEARPGDDW